MLTKNIILFNQDCGGNVSEKQVYEAFKILTASEVVFPPHRIRIMRPRTSLSNQTFSNESTVPKNQFITTPKLFIAKSITPGAALPAVEAFSFGLRGQASGIAEFVSEGIKQTTQIV